MRNMMSVCIALPLGLLLVLLYSCQVMSLMEMCIKTFYLSDGVCKPCPNHCEICTNATQCTLCQMGYYGQLCENECEVGCTRACHKIYGQCTYGCEDGKYPDDNSLACLNCPRECKVCKSLTACAECHTGYYGESCRNMCPGLCKGSLCNKTDGTCFECKEGSYKVDRACIVCPDGCAQCNNSHTCTVCNDGFIGPIHGCCFLECPTIKNKENVNVCNICLKENGSLCNITICQNLPAYWKLQINECHHAMPLPSDCYTEGICVTSNDSLHTEAANTVNMTTESWVSSTCSLGPSPNNNERVLETDGFVFRVAIVVLVIIFIIVALVVGIKNKKSSPNNTRKTREGADQMMTLYLS